MWEVTFFGPKIWSGFGELGSTTPPRIPRSKHPPPPTPSPWNCVELLFELPVESNKHRNFEWRGHGQDRYILFCSPKLLCLNNFIPDCKLSFGLPLRMNGMHRTHFFFNVSLRKFHFTYFFVTGQPRLHKPSGFFWAPLPTYNSYCIIFWLNKNELN